MPTLSARVNVRTNRVAGPNKPRFSKLSDIWIVATVKATDGKPDTFVTVARRTIPGAWNTTAALAEFKKNPKSFAFERGYNDETFRHAA